MAADASANQRLLASGSASYSARCRKFASVSGAVQLMPCVSEASTILAYCMNMNATNAHDTTEHTTPRGPSRVICAARRSPTISNAEVAVPATRLRDRAMRAA